MVPPLRAKRKILVEPPPPKTIRSGGSSILQLSCRSNRMCMPSGKFTGIVESVSKEQKHAANSQHEHQHQIRLKQEPPNVQKPKETPFSGHPAQSHKPSIQLLDSIGVSKKQTMPCWELSVDWGKAYYTLCFCHGVNISPHWRTCGFSRLPPRNPGTALPWYFQRAIQDVSLPPPGSDSCPKNSRTAPVKIAEVRPPG